MAASLIDVKTAFIREGDLVLALESHASMIPLYMKRGEAFHNKWGVFKHDDIIGLPWGTRVRSVFPRCACYTGHSFSLSHAICTDSI